jgi:hypothetical protein
MRHCVEEGLRVLMASTRALESRCSSVAISGSMWLTIRSATATNGASPQRNAHGKPGMDEIDHDTSDGTLARWSRRRPRRGPGLASGRDVKPWRKWASPQQQPVLDRAGLHR